MAKPVPQPEDIPARSTWSLPLRIFASGEVFRKKHSKHPIRDFSGLLSQALEEYLNQHHNGLIEDTAQKLKTLNDETDFVAARHRGAVEKDVLKQVVAVLMNPDAAHARLAELVRKSKAKRKA